MKSLAWFLALFAVAVAITLAAHNPGYVQLVYPPYRIELSLTLFIFILLAIFVILYLALRLITAALHLPEYVRNYREQRTQSKGRSAMMDALNAFFEGRFAAAEKAAARAIELGEKSGLNPIIAARAAHELREFAKRDAYLANANNKNIGDATMRLIAEAEFLLDQKQPKSALDSLHEVTATAGTRHHIGALTLQLKAQRQAGNWDEVLTLVTQLEKRSAIDTLVATQLRQQAWLEKLRNTTLNLDTLRNLWKNIPSELKRRSKIAASAARAFRRVGDDVTARQLLTDSLNAEWDSDLVTLYGDCAGGGVITQIEQAEKWLTVHHDDAGLLLALGKLCLQQSLWGKAQSYLDASISLHPSRESYIALAQLAEKLKNRMNLSPITNVPWRLKKNNFSSECHQAARNRAIPCAPFSQASVWSACIKPPKAKTGMLAPLTISAKFCQPKVGSPG